MIDPSGLAARCWRALALLLLLTAAAAALAQAAPTPRIVAIGDLHGDHTAWRAIAQAANLVDAEGRWTGGTSILVQTGDVPDRGPDTLKIIRDLLRLHREAQRAGGRVVALVGNHEAMNMIGDLRYVDPGEFAAFAGRKSSRRRWQAWLANRPEIEAAFRKTDPALTTEQIQQAWYAATPLGQIEHQAAWSPSGEIGRWVIANPAVALIDGTLFVHAGLGAAYAARPLDDINRRVAAALAARETADSSIINDPLGPLWYRGLASRDPSSEKPAEAEPVLTIEQELDLVLKSQGARRMVIGHTPVLAGIAILHDGRLARIDTGISASYGGTPSWLEIIDGKFIPHSVPRPPPACAAE
jgi:hypothetical protein